MQKLTSSHTLKWEIWGKLLGLLSEQHLTQFSLNANEGKFSNNINSLKMEIK